MNDENTENPGSSHAHETPQNGNSQTEEQKAKGSYVQGPTVGINQEGYFFLKAHTSIGYLALLGFLDEAKLWLREFHPSSLRTQIKKESKIIKPLFRGPGSLEG